MKLNINAKELLALHNMLHARFGDSNGIDVLEYKADDPRVHDATQLNQVYNRLRAIINAALTNPGKVVDPVDSWLKHESAKIDGLRAHNNELVEIAKDPKKLGIDPSLPFADILRDDDDEVPPDLKYPGKRRPPPPHLPIRQGKHKARHR